MRTMFKELFTKSGYKYDYQYDWVILAEKKDKLEKKEEKNKEMNQEEWFHLAYIYKVVVEEVNVVDGNKRIQ